jgi:phage shock protein PspC (stress-responsive transcriptional regulator)
MVAGVAAGLARYLGVDLMIVRIAFVVLTVFSGAGIPLYRAGLLLIPEEGSEQSIAGSLIESLRSRPQHPAGGKPGRKGTACQRKRTSPATAAASSHGSGTPTLATVTVLAVLGLGMICRIINSPDRCDGVNRMLLARRGDSSFFDLEPGASIQRLPASRPRPVR